MFDRFSLPKTLTDDKGAKEYDPSIEHDLSARASACDH